MRNLILQVIWLAVSLCMRLKGIFACGFCYLGEEQISAAVVYAAYLPPPIDLVCLIEGSTLMEFTVQGNNFLRRIRLPIDRYRLPQYAFN